MINEPLNEAVERLLVDRRFMRRFRRNPRRALRPYGLGAREVEAVKSGDAPELLRLGLDPRFISPAPAANPAMVQRWLLNNARRLLPAALLAAATLALGAASPAPAGRRRVRSNLKLKKVKQTDNGVKVTGKVKSKKAACERKRDVGVFGRVLQANLPMQRVLFLGQDRTNRKGKWKVGEDLLLPPGTRMLVRARVVPKDKGNKMCLDDISVQKDIVFE